MTFEDHTDMALARGWAAVRGLARSLSTLLAPGGPIRVSARREAVILIRQAEALVRRAILVMALRLAPPRGPRASTPPSTDALAKLRALPDAAVPAFCLTEPQAAAFTLWEVTDGSDPEPPAPSGPRLIEAAGAEGVVDPGTLIPRLAALQGVLEAPEREARRMARWLRRQRDAQQTGPARIDPLGLGRPPTATPQRRRKHPGSTQALLDLHHFTRIAFDSS